MAKNLQELGSDGLKWAEYFIETKEKNNWSIDDIDEGLMLAWFCTCIETQKDFTLKED